MSEGPAESGPLFGGPPMRSQEDLKIRDHAHFGGAPMATGISIFSVPPASCAILTMFRQHPPASDISDMSILLLGRIVATIGQTLTLRFGESEHRSPGGPRESKRGLPPDPPSCRDRRVSSRRRLLTSPLDDHSRRPIRGDLWPPDDSRPGRHTTSCGNPARLGRPSQAHLVIPSASSHRVSGKYCRRARSPPHASRQLVLRMVVWDAQAPRSTAARWRAVLTIAELASSDISIYMTSLRKRSGPKPQQIIRMQAGRSEGSKGATCSSDRGRPTDRPTLHPPRINAACRKCHSHAPLSSTLGPLLSCGVAGVGMCMLMHFELRARVLGSGGPSMSKASTT